MKVAIYGKKITADWRSFVEDLQDQLELDQVEVCVFHSLQAYIHQHCLGEWKFTTFATHRELVAYNPDFMITIGGDGTILDAVTLVRDSGIPIVGVNLGRMGFLSNISKDNIVEALRSLQENRYHLDERQLLQMSCEAVDMDLNFALNEVTVSRKDSTAMVTVKVWINGQYLNAYWADGLIIATPTGSTGYSLSCNGPIIMPGADSLVLTPIAPHNLNVRPFVIPGKSKIKLQVESREEQFLASLDSRIYTVPTGAEISLEAAPFSIRLVEVESQSFAQTLRSKLMWGLDKRN